MQPITKENQRTAAEIYEVKSFDLRKKQQIIDLSEPVVQELQNRNCTTELGAFCLAINELHFDGDSGLLVSEAAALRVFREAMGISYYPDNSFENFIRENRLSLDSQSTESLKLPGTMGQ
jgi:hypothetical protein